MVAVIQSQSQPSSAMHPLQNRKVYLTLNPERQTTKHHESQKGPDRVGSIHQVGKQLVTLSSSFVCFVPFVIFPFPSKRMPAEQAPLVRRSGLVLLLVQKFAAIRGEHLRAQAF